MICGFCQGSSFELRKRTISNGSIQFVEQCLTCGRAGSNPVSRGSLGNKASLVPKWDDLLSSRWEQRHEQSRLEEKRANRDAWFREHNAYLKTFEWRQRRDAVMNRARGFCEGCARERATQVHHLTYEHWKNEFLWELVAICDGCHERVHEDTPGHKPIDIRAAIGPR